MTKVHRWKEIKKRNRTPEQLEQLELEIQQELDLMTLKELREASGKTQEEVAELAATTQAQLSRIESRTDHRLSTIRRYVEALGGELEVSVKIAGKEIRLRNI
ncbi:MAG: helix-turn-helix transcriptional regulator [Bacteroidota bacterium]